MATLDQLEAEHAEGFTVAQIVDSFLLRGVKLSEATFRKWVQLGLLPRSRRVGRKGKHQGSLGLYPASTVRRIAGIKQLMAESLTIEEIQRTLLFKEAIGSIAHGLGELLDGFDREVAGLEVATVAAERRETARLLADARKCSGELIRRIEELERRIVTPLMRAAKARAFGAGAGGGAGDLL
ncbi:MAG: MerR family transcriptional regulator [Myxococcales bacterium]|nr:MerR family transcriptional regulator [Myxococcales bacterium]